MERYPRHNTPTSTKTPTTISSLVFSIPGDPPLLSQRIGQHHSAPDRNEFPNLRICRPLEFCSRGHQHNFSFSKHRHPIGNPKDLRDFMADHDRGKTKPPL